MKQFLLTTVLILTGTAAWSQTITAVRDAAAGTNNIAQGGFLTIYGSNICDATLQTGSIPYPTTLGSGGTKVTFTPAAGGTGTTAFIYSTFVGGFGCQVSGVLPSTATAGSNNVTVTYNGKTSPAFAATVVQRNFEMFTFNSSVTGRAIVQNFISQSELDINEFTTSGGTSPAHPGETLIAWGTGLGPITGADNTAPGVVDLSKSVTVKVLVNGEAITPFYAGRTPSFPGEDQINFTLPNDVALGCTVTLQVQVGSQLSNATTIAVAPAGAAACVSPVLTSTQLQKLDQGGTITVGSFIVDSLTTTVDLSALGGATNSKVAEEGINGQFAQYSGDTIAGATAFFNQTGTCQVYVRTGTTTSLIFGTPPVDLDAGAITATGPNGFNKPLTEVTDATKGTLYGYSYSNVVLPAGVTLPFPIPGFSNTATISAGTYQLSGAGGKDVGKFTASVTLGPPLTLTTTIPDPISRSADFPVAWTGGNTNDIVSIVGFSGVQSGGTTASPIFTTGEFICTTTAGAGKFTVPASVLSQMPVTPTDTTGTGGFAVLDSTQPSNFTAPLTAGGNTDFAVMLGETGSLTTTHYK